ncbi:hypothetical protein SKAU_G00381880 [Synaphobranchus kaupii]|uniref:Uncharacterized protein n=1 Tax=Synaphobranchus kaupii TaxID=118154 RepID=A0A9Q1EDV3_SYNKA|nr:hypothetical protein SKAU_G00381880 [Synaphobranchus kaupii]
MTNALVIAEADVCKSFTRVNIRKAAGPDGIPGRVIRAGAALLAGGALQSTGTRPEKREQVPTGSAPARIGTSRIPWNVLTAAGLHSARTPWSTDRGQDLCLPDT